ncbi:MAG: hypothetical protein NT154_00005 [Verrucomicrobia bacterium]|nr:hypothetical protein [Verrucomicrobiota bacterium]
MALAAGTGALRASTLYLPNASFESPLVPPVSPYAFPDMDAWQKSAQPAWYEPTNNYNTPWAYLMGTFYNVPYPGSYIDNCDGSQASFLFALPDVALFQDYDSISGTNTTPSHAFNAKFNVNRAYSLTVGVIGGIDGSPPLYEGATLQLSLYYRDAASNMVIVAATTITNSTELFPTNTHFVDFAVEVPGVLPTDPWAGQNIGVQIASTVGFDKANGYWDVDNARLIETPLPALTSPVTTNGGFRLSLKSQPGRLFEMLASTNSSLPLSNWTSLGTLTNITGTAVFFDPATNINSRFYQARQLQ